MSDNVIRHDIVQVDLDVVGAKELQKLQNELNDLKKKLTGGVGDGAFDDMKRGAEETVKPMRKVKEEAEKVSKKVTEIGKKAATVAFKGLKKLASISFKALTVGIGAAVTAIGGLVTKSVQAYAEYEQLFGGMETLLGTKGAKSVEEYAKLVGKSVDSVKTEYSRLQESQTLVMSNANNAFKTANMSANQYMETITSFSAALTTSLGGDTLEAAKLADVAIKDMADNANKMGTPLENVSIVYSNLARGMYMTLDNLKLGYAGTKEGAKQLVNDAAKIDKSVKANDISYANLVKAIHAVQVKMDIFGTTQKEAEKTITGSLNMVKSAWGNLMPALIQGGDAFDQCVDNLVYSVGVFGQNAMPAMEKALSGIGNLIEKLSPMIEKEFPKIVDTLLPPLITAATALLKGLIKALPNIIKTFAKEIPNILKQVSIAVSEAFGEQFSFFKKIGDFFENNSGKIASGIKVIIPTVIALVAAFKGFKAIKSITSLFGGKSSGVGDKGGSGSLFGNITNTFKELSKTNPTVILKGMANLSIIIGGFTLLTAVFMAIAPQMAKLSDGKTVFKMIAVIGALGLVGAGLAKLAGLIGNIPVSIVAKGLANIAIIVAGMSALFLLIGAVSLLNFDYRRILQITGIIAVLGTVGSALSVFAGVVGLIPIPVVLAGLANIALVIGGMTALIVAYGKLAEIPNFNEFISTGGDTLANLFNQIGKIGGALVGGIGEGISNSLPTIGKNLSAFATSLKPMFTMFSGADMSGIGSFFKSIGAFMLQMAGENLLSFFTGGTNLAELGTELTSFATNSQGFFNTVSNFPENGFLNATKLFDCLAGIKGLPKEGGVVGWFTGGISYTTMADGLAQLSSEKVVKFFNTVAEMKEAGFEMATKMFDCLAGLKSLPKDGGVVGWFSGTVDYNKIASGLQELSSEGVSKFFTMVSGLSPNAFENTTKLFESLASISKLPKEGGWWDKITGEETTTLSAIASDLGAFAENSGSFFEQINKLNLGNLNGLWDSLKKSEGVSTNVSKIIDENINDIVTKISELPKKMGDGIKNSGQSLSDGLVSVWKEAVKASVAPVNKVLEAANWILKEFGSEKRVISWTPYAKGTIGHKGGNALVNDGRGAELVQMPNGKSFIPQGRNVLIPNAPKGMKVLPADKTAQIMGRKSSTFNYEKGIGDIDLWSYYDNAQGLVNKISSSVNYSGMSNFAMNVGKGMVSTFTGEMTSWIEKLFDEMGGMSLAAYNPSKGVEQWRSTVIRALKMEGQYSAANVARTLYQMQTESGGNPKAINLWDSNAKKGIPSKGLMQVIDPTFRAYARAGFNTNIYDPLSNILASIRYAVSRYGSLAKAYQGHGYANGGIATKPSIFAEKGAEMAIPLSKSKRNRAVGLWQQTGEMFGFSSYTPEKESGYYNTNTVENNTYSPQFNLTISGTNDDRATARKVKQWVAEAMEDMFTSLENKNRRLREV